MTIYHWIISGCIDEHTGEVLKDPTGGFFTAFFPRGRKMFYKTLPRANIGRCWASALTNVPKKNGRSRDGWADLARYTGLMQPQFTKDGRPRKKTSPSSSVSNRVYQMAKRGILPDDPEARNRVLELAGPPWSSDPDLRL